VLAQQPEQLLGHGQVLAAAVERAAGVGDGLGQAAADAQDPGQVEAGVEVVGIELDHLAQRRLGLGQAVALGQVPRQLVARLDRRRHRGDEAAPHRGRLVGAPAGDGDRGLAEVAALVARGQPGRARVGGSGLGQGAGPARQLGADQPDLRLAGPAPLAGADDRARLRLLAGLGQGIGQAGGDHRLVGRGGGGGAQLVDGQGVITLEQRDPRPQVVRVGVARQRRQRRRRCRSAAPGQPERDGQHGGERRTRSHRPVVAPRARDQRSHGLRRSSAACAALSWSLSPFIRLGWSGLVSSRPSSRRAALASRSSG
jgi:hypothetical protein